MYIVTNYNPNNAMVEILDTKDMVRECLFLAPLVKNMQSKGLSVRGLNKGIVTGAGLQPIPVFGVTINWNDARKALVQSGIAV